jgi:hypothetical protein
MACHRIEISERLLFKTKGAIFQLYKNKKLYHDENKLHLNPMVMKCFVLNQHA